METWSKIVAVAVGAMALQAALIAMFVYGFLVHSQSVPAALHLHLYLTMLAVPEWVMYFLPATAIITALIALGAGWRLMRVLVAAYVFRETSSFQTPNSKRSLLSAYDFSLLQAAIGFKPLRYLRTLLGTFWHPLSTPKVTRKVTLIISLLYLLCLTILGCSFTVMATSYTTTTILLQNGIPGTHTWGKALSSNFTRADLLASVLEAYHTALNASTSNQIARAGRLSLLPIMLAGNVLVVTDPSAPKSEAFLAGSYGAATSVEFANSSICDLEAAQQTFDCPFYTINGSIPEAFPTANLTLNSITPYIAPQDNSSWTIFDWSLPIYTSPTTSLLEAFSNSSSNVLITNSTVFGVLHGLTTAVAVEYIQDGSTVSLVDLQPVNESVTAGMLGAVFPDFIPNYPGFGADLLAASIQSAATTSTSFVDFNISVSNAFSTIALASAVGILEPATTIKENINVKVYAILKAAFGLELAAVALYTVFIVGLCLAALRHILSDKIAVGELATEVGRYEPQTGDGTGAIRAVQGSDGHWRFEADVQLVDVTTDSVLNRHPEPMLGALESGGF